ncbi:unnamed protein product, partial [Rotaria sordida]
IFGRSSACTLYSDLFRIPFNSTFNRYEMIGFYQAYGYFEKYREEIAFLFQFNQGAIIRNIQLVEQLLKGNNWLFYFIIIILFISKVNNFEILKQYLNSYCYFRDRYK